MRKRRSLKMIKRVYLSFGDVVALENAEWYPNSASDISFSTIMTTYGLVIEDTSSEKVSILNQLMRMLYARFYNCPIYRKDIGVYEDEDLVAPSSNERKEIFREFVEIFNGTAPRFIPLLKQFKANENDPIGKISSTTSGTTRFNDTPQDSGDFADDDHTTNITQTEATTETDTGSIMERLDSLYSNWRSILEDWTNVFRGLFYKEG